MRIREVTRGELVEKYILEQVVSCLKPGDKIPSERELSAELEVAVHTVNKSLATLTERGILVRKKGLGTFVAERSLRGKRVRILTFSMGYYKPDFAVNWFNFQYVLEGFSRRAQTFGIVPEIFIQDLSLPPTKKTLEPLLDPDVSGYLFHVHRELGITRQWAECLRENGKIVLCRSFAPFENFNTVYGDMRSGVRDAVCSLLRSGRRRIALLEMAFQDDGYITSRMEGFRDAHAEFNLTPDPALIRECSDLDEESGYVATQDLLKEHIPFDAIFAGTDIRAYGAMRALKEAGLQIPEDVAVIGSDNLPQDLETVPSLSSVNYPMHEIGEALCDLFVEVVRNPSSDPLCRKLKCEFIQRKSS